ncbi:MAG: cbb3-type cytochrome oxidase subunit 3 [Phycisphaerae bacterium]
MSLTDIMSAMQLSQYPTIALVIFFVAFSAIVIYALTKRSSEVQRESRLPLDDGETPSESGARATGSRAERTPAPSRTIAAQQHNANHPQRSVQ